MKTLSNGAFGVADRLREIKQRLLIRDWYTAYSRRWSSRIKAVSSCRTAGIGRLTAEIRFFFFRRIGSPEGCAVDGRAVDVQREAGIAPSVGSALQRRVPESQLLAA